MTGRVGLRRTHLGHSRVWLVVEFDLLSNEPSELLGGRDRL